MSTTYTYKELMDAWHRVSDDLSITMPYVGELSKQLQLDSVRSCVAIGCGYGKPEILLIKQCMPNIKEFIAVEPDAASHDELKRQLAEQLPHVRSVFCQETAQTWSGVDKPVDIVILWHSVYFFNHAEKAALFERLFKDILCSGGFVIILYSSRCISGEPVPLFKFDHLVTGVKLEESLSDTNVRDAIIAAGFKRRGWSLESARHAAKEAFGDSENIINSEWLGIFQKP